MTTATAPAVITEPQSVEARIANLKAGDIVWCSHMPSSGYPSGTLETCPAVVVRVDIPGNPRTTLALMVMSVFVGCKFCIEMSYADKPTADRWTFPDGPTPPPVFGSPQQYQRLSTPPTPGRSEDLGKRTSNVAGVLIGSSR